MSTAIAAGTTAESTVPANPQTEAITGEIIEQTAALAAQAPAQPSAQHPAGGAVAQGALPGRVDEQADQQAWAAGSGRATYPAQDQGDDTRGLAVASFVLGIVSVVAGWTFFAPVTGLVLGIVALRRRTQDRTLAIWGIVLNSVMLALTALLVLVVLVALAIGALTIPFWAIA